MHTTTYELCIALIEIGKTDGLSDKIDIFYAANRLNADEYVNLIQILNSKAEGEKETETPIEETSELIATSEDEIIPDIDAEA